MKNVFNWTVGSFFRTIGRIVAYIIIGSLVALAFSRNMKAATLTPKSTYTNNTNHIIGQDISSFGSNNTYSYTTTLPNLYGEFLWENASTGTAVSGKAYAFSLGFQYNLTAQKYYDITINFRDRDLRSVVNTGSIYLLGGTSISGLSNNNLSLIGVTNSATSSNNTNKLVVRVYSVQAISYFVLQIYDLQNNITSVNNFGISSVSIQEVDITNSQAIINNQTNNTQNIINNQNDTTQQIIDNQNELLGSKCGNLLDLRNWITSFTSGGITTKITGQSLSASGTSTSTSSDIGSASNTFNINLKGGTTYYLTLNKSHNIRLYFRYNDGGTWKNVYSTGSSVAFTPVNDISQAYLFNGGYVANTNISYSGLQASISTSKSFCEYGTYSSKLDDTTNAINDVNETLTDDTTPDSDIGSALNNIDVPQTSYGPFQAFLTIPLQWVQTILAAGQTCQTLHLPLPFVNKNLDLPCMTEFWSSIGVLGVLIQAVWIAVVAVRIFNGLFMLTVETLNTNPDSAMELTKIKSWEL